MQIPKSYIENFIEFSLAANLFNENWQEEILLLVFQKSTTKQRQEIYENFSNWFGGIDRQGNSETVSGT
jgi:hypothetical protein